MINFSHVISQNELKYGHEEMNKQKGCPYCGSTKSLGYPQWVKALEAAIEEVAEYYRKNRKEVKK